MIAELFIGAGCMGSLIMVCESQGRARRGNLAGVFAGALWLVVLVVLLGLLLWRVLP